MDGVCVCVHVRTLRRFCKIYPSEAGESAVLSFRDRVVFIILPVYEGSRLLYSSLSFANFIYQCAYLYVTVLR